MVCLTQGIRLDSHGRFTIHTNFTKHSQSSVCEKVSGWQVRSFLHATCPFKNSISPFLLNSDSQKRAYRQPCVKTQARLLWAEKLLLCATVPQQGLGCFTSVSSHPVLHLPTSGPHQRRASLPLAPAAVCHSQLTEVPSATTWPSVLRSMG